jgi:hypothetical protein
MFPWLLDLAPWLTPLTPLGLALTAFVVWGRWGCFSMVR